MKPSRGSLRCVLALALVGAPRAASSGPSLVAHGDRLLVLPPRVHVQAGRARTLGTPLPATGFAAITPVSLPGPASTPPLPLADGGLAIGVSTPPCVVWVDGTGHVTRTAPLDDRPEGDLAVGADGRIYAAAANRMVYTLAPDGTTRGAHQLAAPTVGGIHALADGSLLVLTNASTSMGEASLLSPEGDSLGAHALPGAVVGRPLASTDCVWIPLTSGVSCLDAAARPTRTLFNRGSSMVALAGSDAIAAVLGNELQFYGVDGAARGRVDVGPNSLWLSSTATGVVVYRSASPPELMLVAPDGTVSARIASTSSWLEGVLTDPEGAMLVVSRAGEIVALESDGSERWRVELRQSVSRPATALPSGGIAIQPSGGGLLLVH